VPHGATAAFLGATVYRSTDVMARLRKYNLHNADAHAYSKHVAKHETGIQDNNAIYYKTGTKQIHGTIHNII